MSSPRPARRCLAESLAHWAIGNSASAGKPVVKARGLRGSLLRAIKAGSACVMALDILIGIALKFSPFCTGAAGEGRFFQHDMADIGARAAARLQQPFGDQTFNRIDNGGSGNSQVFCQGSACREALARL